MVDKTVEENDAAESDDFRIPETWAELCENEPLFSLLPPLAPAERLSFKQAAQLRKLSSMAGFTLNADINGPEAKSLDDIEVKIDERMEFVGTALDWVKSLTVKPDKVDEWATGIGLDELFWLIEAILMFYTDQLGKSLASKRKYASTRSN